VHRGSNGSGKSTLLKTVMVCSVLGWGRSFQGTPLVGKTPREILKMGIVQVPQQHSLFKEMTVEENVSLGFWSEIVVRCRAASNRCARSFQS